MNKFDILDLVLVQIPKWCYVQGNRRSGPKTFCKWNWWGIPGNGEDDDSQEWQDTWGGLLSGFSWYQIWEDLRVEVSKDLDGGRFRSQEHFHWCGTVLKHALPALPQCIRWSMAMACFKEWTGSVRIMLLIDILFFTFLLLVSGSYHFNHNL